MGNERPNPKPCTSQARAELHPATHTAAVVAAAEAFLTTLTDAQRSAVLVAFSPENASRWSNFPAGVVPRNGLLFRDLRADQRDAALHVARVTLSDSGFARMQQIRLADDEYAQSTASRRGPGQGTALFRQGNYVIALLGQPSTTDPWMLQFGGHHLAINHAYHGPVAAATPYFVGIEPIGWTDADGQAHDPLKPMRDAMEGVLQSLTPAQVHTARLGGRFEDVVVGPGRDGQFPSTREGVAYGELSAAAQRFVQHAILAWTGDSAQAEAYQRRYGAELEETRIAYGGTGKLKEVGDYVRIDGPHVWIEVACQPSRTEFPIHVHSVWRDRATDYGNAVHPNPWENRPAK